MRRRQQQIKRCYCGASVPKGRSKFCSPEHARLHHSGNVAALKLTARAIMRPTGNPDVSLLRAARMGADRLIAWRLAQEQAS